MAEETFLQKSDMEGRKMKVGKKMIGEYEVYYPFMINEPFSDIYDGRKIVAVAGTRERLVASPTPSKRVIIMAMLANTGEIVVGGSTVVAAEATRQGVPLTAGQSIQMEIDDLYKIYLDATVSGEGVTFIYFT